MLIVETLENAGEQKEENKSNLQYYGLEFHLTGFLSVFGFLEKEKFYKLLFHSEIDHKLLYRAII